MKAKEMMVNHINKKIVMSDEKDIYDGLTWGEKVLEVIETHGPYQHIINGIRMKYSIIEEHEGATCFADTTMQWDEITKILKFFDAESTEIEKSHFPLLSTVISEDYGRGYVWEHEINNENEILIHVKGLEGQEPKVFSTNELTRKY